MHRAPAGPAHQDRAYEFVECPMKAARQGQSDIDPTNMVRTGKHGATAAEHLCVEAEGCVSPSAEALTCGSCSLPVYRRCLLPTRSRLQTSLSPCLSAERSPPFLASTTKTTGFTLQNRCSGMPCCGRGQSKLLLRLCYSQRTRACSPGRNICRSLNTPLR